MPHVSANNNFSIFRVRSRRSFLIQMQKQRECETGQLRPAIRKTGSETKTRDSFDIRLPAIDRVRRGYNLMGHRRARFFWRVI